MFYAFTYGAMRMDGTSLRDDPSVLLRIAIPTIAALLALLLRNGWTDPEDRPQYAPALDAAVAIAFVLLSQKALSIFSPALMLPRWAPTQGGAAGWVFLVFLLAEFPPRERASPCSAQSAAPVSTEELRWRVEEFERDILARNRTGYLVAAALLALFAVFGFTSAPGVRAGATLMIAGVAYMLWQIRKRGLPAPVPQGGGAEDYRDFHRRELQRQAGFFQRVWFWYFGSLVPACVLFLSGTAKVYPKFVILYILLIAELIWQATEALQRDIDDLSVQDMRYRVIDD